MATVRLRLARSSTRQLSGSLRQVVAILNLMAHLDVMPLLVLIGAAWVGRATPAV